MNRFTRKIASIITAAAVAFSAVTLPDMGLLPSLTIPAFATTENLGGYDYTKESDSEGDYYKIDCADALNALASYVNSGNNCENMRFKQTADIDMKNVTFTPIANDEEKPFKGAYDGDGYVIKNISHYDSGLYSLSGLFGLLKGSVKNVNLKDCSFGGRNAGGIAGEMDDDDGTVQNCTVLGGTITCTDGSGAGHFGGIVGYFYGGAVDGCFTTTTFSGNGSTMGPVVGMDEDVTNCYYVNTPGGNSRGTEVTVYDITLGDGLTVSGNFRTVGKTEENTYYFGQEGDTVTLTVTPDSGYQLKLLTVGENDVTADVTDNTYSFTMPAADVTAEATFIGVHNVILPDISNDSSYVSLTASVNGSTNTSSDLVAEGTKVTITAALATGYELDTSGPNAYHAESGGEDDSWFTLYKDTNGVYSGSFDMPDRDANIFINAPQKIDYDINYYYDSNKGDVDISCDCPCDSSGNHYGETITVTATPDNGYRLATLTVTDEDNNDVTVSGTGNTRTFTMPASDVTVEATFEPIPATEPFISIQNKPQDRSVYYGYNEEITLTSTADNITGHTLSYQWYSCDDKNKTNAQKIEGATSSSYTVPTGKSLGDYYHYCVVTATREDNGQTATTDSYVARFSVNKKRVSITGLSVSGKVYDGTTDATVTGTAAISGKVGDDDDVTVTAGTAAFADANAGTDKTVTFSGYSLSGTAADNYRLIAQPESVKADITAKEVSLSWTDTQFTFDGDEHCPTATAGELISGDTCGVNVTGGQTNAGDSYTATAESLTNGNYKLPADKTIEFSIDKADAAAPAAITKSYLYSKGGSDNITLTGLPEDCGNVVWGAPNTSGSLSWSNFSVTAGVLHYTVSGGTVNTEGIIGVTAETDNYKNITFTVKVKLVDKLPVKPKTDTSVTLKNSTLTYGQTLSALTFNTAVFVSDDAEEKTVAGTLAWKEPAAVPAAGTAGATWVFTPSDENYASCEGTAAITVNKATPTISEAPAAAAIAYGQTLGDSALTGGKAVAGNTELNGAFSWKEPSVAPNAADSGSTKYAAVFTPTDSNYESVIVKLTLTVAKKAITPAVTVTGDYTYNGSNIIPTFTVNNGDDELAATDYTVSYSGNVNAGTNTASLTVTAATGGNYTFEAVTATFSIAKATYGDKNVNVSILYGTSKTVDLSGYVCTGGTLGSVTVSDENGIISGTPSVSGKTVTITLADDATKEGKTATVTIPVTSENYNDHRILLTVTLTNCSHTHTELRNYRAATCIVDGYSGDTYCKDCGEKLSTGHTTTDPLGHSEAAPVRENEIAADCTTAGNYDEVVYCTRCHAELSRTTRTAEALGHDPGAPIRENFISAACTTAGSYDEVVYCTRCNTEIGRTPITLPSLGHDYVSGKCTRCGAVEVAPGNLQDIIDSAEEESLTLALDSDTDLSKLKFPKNVKEIAIDGGGHTLGFTGAASLKPNQKLTLSNITIKAEKNGKPQNITITAAAGGLVLENVTLDGKKATVTATKGDLTLGNVTANDLNVKGSANTKLTIDGDVDAARVSGFGTVEVAVALTVTKSLSVNEMKLSDGAVLNVAAGVAVTVKKGISGNGTVHLAEGFKPISISGSITGRIALTSNASMTDGTLLFKSKLTDLDEHFDVSGIAPEVTDGEYSYGLYSKSGKVYLRAFKMQVGDHTYCEWADIMSGITKSKADAKDYTLTLLGDMDIAAALKLPTKGKYAGLTIDGSGHSISFSGTTLTLTGDLTLKNVKITAMKNGKPVAWTIKMKQYKLVTENAVLENCTVK